jgi:hypothetical protein
MAAMSFALRPFVSSAKPPKQIKLEVVLEPVAVHAGQRVYATAYVTDKKWFTTVRYWFCSDAGYMGGRMGSNVRHIDTTGLKPGLYTVKANVDQGDQPSDQANASATFMVREPSHGI